MFYTTFYFTEFRAAESCGEMLSRHNSTITELESIQRNQQLYQDKSKTHAAWLCTALDTTTARKRILEQATTSLDFNANAHFNAQWLQLWLLIHTALIELVVHNVTVVSTAALKQCRAYSKGTPISVNVTWLAGN